MGRPIYVEIDIAAPLDVVWERTQAPAQHSRWDWRFSSIEPVEELPGGGYRFVYERSLRLAGRTLIRLTGDGVSIGEHERPDGTRTSALKFAPHDRRSPIGDGRGYWRYRVRPGGGVTFITGYDYQPGWGSMIDRLVARPFIGWMTAWSFDRLRLWAEHDVAPETYGPWSILKFWDAERPRASRCRRQAPGRDAFRDAPATLDTLPESR